MEKFKLGLVIIILIIQISLFIYYIGSSIYLKKFHNDELQYIREDCVDYSNEADVRCLKKQITLKNRRVALGIMIGIGVLSYILGYALNI